MTETRDISTPTCISLCLSGKYILLKDLAGKSHVFSLDDKTGIGEKIIELAQDKELPFVDVGKVSVTDEQQSTSSLSDIDLDDLDPDNIKKIFLQQGIGWLKNFTSYPRGKFVSKNKSGK